MSGWWWKRKADDADRYSPQPYRNGEPEEIPPAVYRKLDQIKLAMVGGNRARVRSLQQNLIKGGFEVPTNPEECDQIKERYRIAMDGR